MTNSQTYKRQQFLLYNQVYDVAESAYMSGLEIQQARIIKDIHNVEVVECPMCGNDYELKARRKNRACKDCRLLFTDQEIETRLVKQRKMPLKIKNKLKRQHERCLSCNISLRSKSAGNGKLGYCQFCSEGL